MVETMIAVMILVTGISAAVGLAIFAFASSQNITKQLVAIGLAREGIEVVKNMRDTNWLKQITIDSTCYDPTTQTNIAKCYLNWQTQNSNINAVSGTPPEVNGHLVFDLIAGLWKLETCNALYGINFDPNISGASFAGFYTTLVSEVFCPSASAGVSHTVASSDFARQIVITEDDGVALYGSGANNPFNKNSGPRLVVKSRVWWADKKCPRNNVWPGVGKCSVEIQTYLTNWKNY